MGGVAIIFLPHPRSGGAKKSSGTAEMLYQLAADLVELGTRKGIILVVTYRQQQLNEVHPSEREQQGTVGCYTESKSPEATLPLLWQFFLQDVEDDSSAYESNGNE